jgi:WD40 repeat protein
MSGTNPARSPDRDNLLRRDQTCDRFEQAWRRGARPQLEDYLPQGSEHDPRELFADLLTIELAYRRRLGEQPTIEVYEDRFPNLAGCLPAIFSRDATRAAPELTNGRVEPSTEVSSTNQALNPPPADGRAVTRPPIPSVPGYEMLGELGRGGMGVVYLARHIRLDRLCALKMISAGELADPAVAARFFAEATTVARLDHPHIVQIYHIGDHAGVPYFEFEYVRGGSLAARLDGTPWPPKNAASLAESLAIAMEEAHRLGIVHRDLKPSNILITAEGEPKITDFGLAKLLGGGSDLTRTDSILGTPSYMAPEQAWGHAREVGPRADVYAVGAILYELLTGRPPFKGADALETVEQVKSVEPVAPSRLQPGLPRDLETICVTCLQKEPGRRYASALALADDLRRYQRGEPIRARRSGRAEQAWKWCRRNPVMATLTGVSAVLLLSLTVGPAVTALVWTQQRDKARLAEQAAADQRDKARLAEQAAADQLRETHEAQRETYAVQARSLRSGGQPGRRFEALEVLAKAALIRPGPDLRDEAIACMALVDLRVAQEWPIHIPSFSRPAADWKFDRYAVGDERGSLAIHSLEDDRLLQSLPGFGTRCQAMQFSPDGRFLAAAHDDHEFYFWDLAQGEVLPWITGEVTAWAFSSDGRQMAIGRGDRSVVLHSLSDGQPQGRFNLDDIPVSLDFSPDGKFLAAAYDHAVKILDVATGREPATLSHGETVRCVCWGSSGRLLASVSYRNRTCVWEVNGRKPVWRDEPHLVTRLTAAKEIEARHLAFSPGGDLLAGEGLEGIRIFDAWTGRVLLTVPGLLSGAQGSDAFSPDGKSLFGLTSDRSRAVRWEVGRGTEFRQVVQYAGVGTGTASSVDFRPGDHLLAVGEGRGARLVDPDRCVDLQLVNHPANGVHLAWLETGPSEAVRFRPDGRGLVTAALCGLTYWPVEIHDEGNTRRHVVGPPRTLYQSSATSYACTSRVAWGPGGRFLIWSDFLRGEAIIEDLEGKSGRRVLSGIPNLRDLAVSPDGRWLVTCPWRGTAIEVRDLRDGHVVWKRAASQGRALCSPDGRMLVTSVDDTVGFWQVGSWRFLREVSCKGASTMAFSLDGSLLAVNSANGIVRLIDPQTGGEEARLENPDPGIDPLGLAFSSDGALLAMANGRRGVQIWDLERVRQTLGEIGLAWKWPQPTRTEVPKILGALELHELKRDARQAEHAGEWSRAIPMRTALIAADPVDSSQWHRRGHDRVQLGRWAEALGDFEAASRVERVGTKLRGDVGSLAGSETIWDCWRPVPGRWYHLALTFDDDTGILTEFVDGSIQGRVHTARPAGYDRHPLVIGAIIESGLPQGCFWGDAADVRMWRIARSQVHIQADVRGSPAAEPADLIGRWNPEAAASGTLVDTSGHHHDGRLVGNVSVVPIGRAVVPAGFPACRYALRFDGSNCCVEIPDADWLRPRSFTVEGWFNFARGDRGCWLFSRHVGDRRSISLGLSYQDELSAEELEVRVAQALSLLAVNDRQGYRRLCARLLERYRETRDAPLAREVAHICSMGPAALEDYGPCLGLAERAVAAQGGHELLGTLGSTLYRAGQFQHATRQLRQAISAQGGEGSPRDQLFLAMASHAMGDEWRAREELKKTETSILRALDAESQRRGGDRWPDDWLTPTELGILKSEAEGLLMDSAFPANPFR